MAIKVNNIISGPSKWLLSVAFFDRENGRRSVKFTVNGPDFKPDTIINVVVNKLSWEDGSGESWIFEGFIKGTMLGVTGWFRTDNRGGTLQLVK